MSSNNTSTMKSRSRGMLLGLAIGDALGAPVEFLPGPGSLYTVGMGDKIADTLLKMPKCPILHTRFEDDENFKTPD